MDSAQVQVFRRLVRALGTAFADTDMHINGCESQDTAITKGVRTCDDTIRELLVTFDPQQKLEITKQFCTEKLGVLEEIAKEPSVFQARNKVNLLPTVMAGLIEPGTQQRAEILEGVSCLGASLNEVEVQNCVQLDIGKIRTELKGCLGSEEAAKYEETLKSYVILFRCLDALRKARDYAASFNGGTIPSDEMALCPTRVVKYRLPIVKKDKMDPLPNLKKLKIEGEVTEPSKGKQFKAQLDLGGIVGPEQLKKRRSSRDSSGSRDSTGSRDEDLDMTVLEFNRFMALDLPNSKDPYKDISDSQRKLLKRENELLRENVYILKSQKEDMMKFYEDYIKELLRQNAFLKSELEKKNGEKKE